MFSFQPFSFRGGVNLRVSLVFQALVSRCLDPQTPPENAFRGPNISSQGISIILED